MTWVDRYLQERRIKAALPWIPPQSHVLDVGCYDGALFRRGASRISSGVGIDVLESPTWDFVHYEFRNGRFPDSLQPDEKFDAVVMLAVVEHVTDDELARWFAAIPERLTDNGRVIITVPSPLVDRILKIGIRLRLLEGMEVHQHHGFDPNSMQALYAPHFRVERRRRFELGLNHLFVLTPR